MFFFRKRNIDPKLQTYEIFKKHIDDNSLIKINGTDLSFNLFKGKLEKEGIVLTELDCSKDNEVIIKRNKNGYCISPNFKRNKFVKEIMEKYKADFTRLHKLLKQKEKIMAGCYYSKRMDFAELQQLAQSLGYGVVREQALIENED